MQYIAEQFVRQYYLILQNSPWQLHHFYKATSVHTVQTAGQALTVQGAAMIGKRINESLPNSITPEMEGKERSCEIKDISWMHQVSLPGSLVVVATGIQSNPKNGQSNRFYQTFVLASEQGQANAFYVHNDMSCLTAVDAPPMVAAPAPHPAPTMGVQIPNGTNVAGAHPTRGSQGLVPMSPPGPKVKPQVVPPAPVVVPEAAPATPEKKDSPKFGTVPEEEGLAPPASLDIGKPTIPASAAPVAQNPVADPTEDSTPGAEETQEAETTASKEVAGASQQDEAVAKASAPAGPCSWAAMAAKQAAPKPAPPPPSKPARKNATEGEAKEPAAPDETTPAPRKERAAYNKSQAAETDLEASVFVSGVPHTCDEDRLKELFGKYGEVHKVSLKADKHFAIIDFTSSDAAAAALKTAAIREESSVMKVEARRKSGGGAVSGGGGSHSKSRGKGEGRGSGERGRGKGSRDSRRGQKH